MISYYYQTGGGNCTLCGSPNTNRSTCPLNSKVAKDKHNPEKHPNAAKILAAKTTSVKIEIEKKPAAKKVQKIEKIPKPEAVKIAAVKVAAAKVAAVKVAAAKKKKKKAVCTNGNTGEVVFVGEPMLAQTIKSIKTFNPIGWYASEKFDGYRAIWNGKEFVSRQGNPFSVPEWFSALMPPSVSLDGELWMGRCKFEACGLFRHGVADEKAWIQSEPKYVVFDIHMESQIPFEERMEKLQEIVDERCQCLVEVELPREVIEIGCPLVFAPQHLVQDKESLMKYYREIVKGGAEGVMLRKPGSIYEQKRSYTLMKLKPEFDDECVIVGYKPGTGKYTGKLGSFQCEWINPDGRAVRFYMSGMTDDIRKTYLETHPIGTVITFKFKGLTKKGVPRHPNYQKLFSRP